MDTATNSIGRKIKFWSILGPFMTLLIFLVYLVKLSPSHLYLSLVALGGIGLCWQWKMKGLAVSLVILAGLLFASFSSVAVAERFWFVGLAMASALSFVVTALSYEEIEILLTSDREASKNRLSHIAALDEKLNTFQKTWNDEKEKLLADLNWTEEKKKDCEAKCSELELKLENAELQNEKLAEEVEAYKGERAASQMAEKYQVERTVLPKEEAPADNYEPLYRQLRKQFEEKGKVLDDTRRELFATKESLALMKKELEEKTTFGQDDCYLKLEKDFIVLSQDYDRLDRLYREEVTELHGLVGSLLEQN
jgi:septal ring factor EnvC (AmiA/AmiB activator)